MPGCTKGENMKLFTAIAPKKTAKAFCTFVGAIDIIKNCNWYQITSSNIKHQNEIDGAAIVDFHFLPFF